MTYFKTKLTELEKEKKILEETNRQHFPNYKRILGKIQQLKECEEEVKKIIKKKFYIRDFFSDEVDTDLPENILLKKLLKELGIEREKDEY